MTLIIALARPEGIYMSVDYRVTNRRTRKVMDDAAPKHLHVDFPPFQTGPKALLGYTGVAELPDGTKTRDWIRETLRGGDEYFDDAMAHLQARLNRDYAQFGQPLIINALVLDGERRLFGGLGNLRYDSNMEPSRQRVFGYDLRELDGPTVYMNGAAAYTSIGRAQTRTLQRQAMIAPRDPDDYMKLLASANRKIARSDPTVSPHCTVAFIPPQGTAFAPHSTVYPEGAASLPFEMPYLMCGIDLTYMSTKGAEMLEAMRRGEEPKGPTDEDGVNATKRRA